jgi:hypothetical protein
MNAPNNPMELIYKTRGADGKEYGPVSLNQLNTWLREGRVNPQSEVMRSDMDYWSPAASFSELQGAAPPDIQPVSANAPAGSTAAPGDDLATIAQMKSGASWFYWIAALSLVNSFAASTGSDWRFILGLGITQIIDAFGQSVEGTGRLIALVLSLIVAGVSILFGVLAGKRHTWAFIIGMALFALDGLIFLLVQDWIGVAFHAFVLYCFFRGFQACRTLNAA